jgi:hypothetical protein
VAHVLPLENIPAEMRDRRQWVLWKYEHRGGKPTKVPYRSTGYPASSVCPEQWTGLPDALAALSAASDVYAGVGFVFADGDDLVGVDLDGCLDGGAIAPWALEILERVPGYAEVSPSGKGVKIFCRGKFPADRGRNVRFEHGGGVELYGRGRYFTVTGRAYYGAAVETLPDASDGLAWLAETHFAEKPTQKPTSAHKPAREPVGPSERAALPVAHESQRRGIEAYERAERYANKYPPAISGENGHGTAYRLACVLVNGFALDRSEALGILHRWNTACQPPWSTRELEHKIDSALEAGSREGDRGYMLTERQYAEPAASGEYEVYLGDLLANYEAKLGATFPPNLYHVPGFVAEVAGWITSQNPRPNLILSLLAGLSLQAALVARKVKDKTGMRTNLYIVALAPSSGGKQAPVNGIQEILGLTGQSALYGGKVASDSAIAQDLVASPAKLYLFDEFGRFLAKTRERTGGAHLHAVQEALLELWGATRNPLWKHKSMAEAKFNREIPYPCVGFLGFTVPSNFWDSLEESHLSDGFAARLIVVDTGPRPESRSPVEIPPPQSVLDRAAYWRDFAPGGDLAKAGRFDPIVIPSSPEAEDAFAELVAYQERHEGEVAEAIWSRAIEKARRLAMVFACSRNHESPEIDLEAARWAIEFVKWATSTFIAKAAEEVTGGEAFQLKYKRVLKLIREKSSKRHQCTRSTLLRATKWRAKELDEVLHALEHGDEIERQEIGEGRRATTTYRVKK